MTSRYIHKQLPRHKKTPPDGTHMCSRCKQFFPRDELGFSWLYKAKQKRYYYCNGCNAARMRDYRTRSPLKAAAHSITQRSIKNGTLLRPGLCQFPLCANAKVQAHHGDYSKPLLVHWYCLKHHRIVDIQMISLSQGQTLLA